MSQVPESVQSQEQRPSPVNRVVNLLSLNCFLVPSLFTFKKVNSSCTLQDIRAERIGRFGKDKELLVFQEVWGSHLWELEKSLTETHDILPSNRTTWIPFAAQLIDPLRFWVQKTGGLWFAQKKDIAVVSSSQHTFSVSESRSNKGVQSVIFDMDAYWPGKFLLVFNTHLDPINVENRKQQLSEIKEFMEQSIAQLQAHTGIQLSKTGLLLLGDFNIASSTEEHDSMMQILGGPRDLYWEHMQQTGQPEEYTYEASNPLFTGVGGTKRIDYVLAFDTFNEVQLMQLNCLDIRVQKQPEEELLSDHWPQLVTLLPKAVE